MTNNTATLNRETVNALVATEIAAIRNRRAVRKDITGSTFALGSAVKSPAIEAAEAMVMAAHFALFSYLAETMTDDSLVRIDPGYLHTRAMVLDELAATVEMM